METVQILLVEDNPVDALCFKEALEESRSTNFSIVHVDTLAEAKDRLEQGHFHAVVLDLGLSDSRGMETFLGIKNSNSEVPIVVLSGMNDETLAIETLREGAQDYLLKEKWDGYFLSRSINFAIQRRQAEKALRETQERFGRVVADVASGVAHNFNNLLQVVIGSANLAIKQLQSGEFSNVKENLERILYSSQSGAETVRRLNRFARTHLEGEEYPLTEVFDLSDLVSQAVEITIPWWKTHPEKKGIVIDLATELADGCIVKGKKNEMFEVLINLLKNATEALPNGGAIRIETRLEPDGIVLYIRDNGVGIPEKDVDRVFTPFFTTNAEVGRGLGLATSRKIVDEHGGRISVTSAEGQGTAFVVSLPLLRTVPEMHTVAPMSIKDKPLAILVIDDTEVLVEVIRDGLEAFGHTVFTALSGEEGLAIFRNHPVDLVICDLGLLGMNGWEVGEAVKDLCSARKVPKPPFVILTGWSDQSGEKEKIVKSGVDRVIQKPVDMSKLLAVISSLAQKS